MQTKRNRGNPVLSRGLIERVLLKLGLTDQPALNLHGLNTLFAAFCGSIPFDNIQKRIWFAGDQTTPLTGGDPNVFFENWLVYGTGGTCWSINGGICALLGSIGFKARRIAGSMIVEGVLHGANHGSVLVRLDDVDYLVDANIGSFKVLPLVPGTPASRSMSIHDIAAVPIKDGFDVLWYTGISRKEPLVFRPEPELDPVDHTFFLEAYDRTKSKGYDLFNYALYICRRFTDSIVTVGRNNKLVVTADNAITKTEVVDTERKRILVEELGISEESIDAIPPDVPLISSTYCNRSQDNWFFID
jgi:N-hydroxyarylamine O-acetyltransferase